MQDPTLYRERVPYPDRPTPRVGRGITPEDWRAVAVFAAMLYGLSFINGRLATIVGLGVLGSYVLRNPGPLEVLAGFVRGSR